jgi:putative flippase GtrA
VSAPGLARHWLKFNAVGAAGIGVQLGALALLHRGLGLGYLAATALAVETAVLHNFAWHERWTWRERTAAESGRRARLGRLARFHLSSGTVSIAANVASMRVLVGEWHAQYLAANLLSIAAASLANFLLSELYVFRKRRPRATLAEREFAGGQNTVRT